MYDRIDVVAEAERRAEPRVLADRLRYAKFFEAAEKFAVENSLVLGGAVATRLLLAEGVPPVTLESFQRYDFFSGQAPAMARALGDALYALDPEGLAHYTTVVTKVPSYQLAVSVDGRELFTITALPVHRGVKTAAVVIPSYRPAQFAPDARIACMGPEVQLMGVYAALCNPGAAGEWAALLAVEARLRALFAREVHEKIATATARVADGGRGGQGGRSTRDLYRSLYRRYVAGAGRVLVGPAAIALLQGAEPGMARIQVVTVSPLRGEAAAVAEIAAAHGVETQWTENDPKIPTDPRLRRMTIYAQREGRREPFMDIYNAAAHELVPYTTVSMHDDALVKVGTRDGVTVKVGTRDGVTVKVGTPFAVMRFRLADMWAMQVLMQMRAVSPEFGRETLHAMLDSFEEAAELLGSRSPPELLPLADYVGRYEDPLLALRRAAQAGGDRGGAPRFNPPYMPAMPAASKN